MLTAWRDSDLVDLLTHRPDLCRPAPASLEALATRAQSPSSLGLAARHCDAWMLRVAAELAARSDPTGSITAATLARHLGQPARDVTATLGTLARMAMAWPSGRGWCAPAALGIAVGPPANGTGRGPQPPAPPAADIGATIDLGAGGRAMLAMDAAEEVLLDWAERPPPVLRNGGLGQRAVSGLAARQNLPEPIAAALLEWLLAAGLIGIDPVGRAAWRPTGAFDTWRDDEHPERWASLAGAWWRTDRMGVVAAQGRGRASPLSPAAVVRGSAALRRALVRIVATHPGATWTTTSLAAQFDWWCPRLLPGQREALLMPLLAEARWLGVLTETGVSEGGLALLDTVPAAGGGRSASSPDPSRQRAVIDAARAMMPPVSSDVIVQADLTITVPGPAAPALARRLSEIADLESRGGARVYRLTERTLRRAIDMGADGGELEQWLAQHSRTPLPQALCYLLRECTRQHAALGGETGGPGMDAEVAGDRVALGADRRAAPPPVSTARVGLADPAAVVAMLRATGAPAGTGASGSTAAVGSAPRPGRAQTLPDSHGESAAGEAAADGAAIAMITLTLTGAIAAGARLWLGYTDAHGATAERLVRPIGLLAGRLSVHDLERQAALTIPIAHVTGVALAEDDDG